MSILKKVGMFITMYCIVSLSRKITPWTGETELYKFRTSVRAAVNKSHRPSEIPITTTKLPYRERKVGKRGGVDS